MIGIRVRASAWLGFAAIALAVASAASAATIWDEGVNGDLSNNRLAPTVLSVSPGSNTIIGSTVQGNIDYFTFTVPVGYEFSALILSSFSSADDVAFLAIQAGSTFTEPASGTVVGNLLGYTHIGTGALAGTADPGTDILDELGAGVGSIGFTPPLGAGAYTFWLQQTQPQVVGYGLDVVLTVAAPEPAGLLLGALAIAGVVFVRRR
jgi:hypothetical protein